MKNAKFRGNMFYNIRKYFAMSKISSTFAPEIKTTQSFLYLKNLTD